MRLKLGAFLVAISDLRSGIRSRFRASRTAAYDETNRVTIKGTVTQFSGPILTRKFSWT